MIKTTCLIILFMVAGTVIAIPGTMTRQSRGETLFRKHCIVCHPKPGAMKDEDVIGRMRNPVAPMPFFDEDKISDADARLIADYIKNKYSTR